MSNALTTAASEFDRWIEDMKAQRAAAEEARRAAAEGARRAAEKNAREFEDWKKRAAEARRRHGAALAAFDFVA